MCQFFLYGVNISNAYYCDQLAPAVSAAGWVWIVIGCVVFAFSCYSLCDYACNRRDRETQKKHIETLALTFSMALLAVILSPLALPLLILFAFLIIGFIIYMQLVPPPPEPDVAAVRIMPLSLPA